MKHRRHKAVRLVKLSPDNSPLMSYLKNGQAQPVYLSNQHSHSQSLTGLTRALALSRIPTVIRVESTIN